MNALDIAEALAERLELEDPVAEAPNFGSGSAGIALFFFALAQERSSERWARAAHVRLKAAATDRGATPSGLFNGLAGLLFVSSYAARLDGRYASLREQCVRALVASGATAPVPRAAERAREYDLVSGIAGIHAALVYAGCDGEATGTRAYLEWLVADEQRWRCRHALDTNSERGRVNDVGIAHGLAGLVSVLASDEAVAAGTLEYASEALWEKRVPGTLRWPASVGAFPPEPTRIAWCYGNPGVAMALLRVAQRTNSETIAERARAILLDVVALPRASWSQIDAALCHGAAGNGLILATAGGLIGDERIEHCATDVVDELLQEYDASLRLGYRSWDNLGSQWVDDPSLMSGTAGIGLALVSLAGSPDNSWMSAFALPEPAKKATGTTC